MDGIEKLSEAATCSFGKRKQNTTRCEPDRKALTPALLHLTDIKHYWTKSPQNHSNLWGSYSEAASNNSLAPVHVHQYMSSITHLEITTPMDAKWQSEEGQNKEGHTASWSEIT